MQYVQHKSGQGEKWKFPADQRVCNITPNHPHFVAVDHLNGGELCLPKSEYVLCDPPEVWKDVTNECRVSPDITCGRTVMRQGISALRVAMIDNDYRFNKVQLYGYPLGDPRWAFIIEKKGTV